MEKIKRLIDISKITRDKSVFLLGSRQTGKSFLITHTLSSKVPVFDLLDKDIFLTFSNDCTKMRQQLREMNYHDGLVVIDEIQTRAHGAS